MKRFYLYRKEDETGVSGTGTIAEGVEFSDGSCAMRWRTATSSTVIYKDIVDLIYIHGHGGKTEVRWLDS